MTIFQLKETARDAFAKAEEIFANIQFGKWGTRYFLVIGCQVAMEFDEKTPSDLDKFYSQTWRTHEDSGEGLLPGRIVERYNRWMGSLDDIAGVEPHWITRAEVSRFIASVFPSPPPDRPTLVPAYTPPPSLPQNYYGHLPFKTKTRLHEHFYRFEAWPTSRKITVGDPGDIAANTYASPSAELPFLNTGFAAVARNALPSLFPAVFRYELQPAASKSIHCGAVIPNYGQSGGGVEVYFPSQVPNRGPIANPVVIPPL